MPTLPTHLGIHWNSPTTLTPSNQQIYNAGAGFSNAVVLLTEENWQNGQGVFKDTLNFINGLQADCQGIESGFRVLVRLHADPRPDPARAGMPQWWKDGAFWCLDQGAAHDFIIGNELDLEWGDPGDPPPYTGIWKPSNVCRAHDYIAQLTQSFHEEMAARGTTPFYWAWMAGPSGNITPCDPSPGGQPCVPGPCGDYDLYFATFWDLITGEDGGVGCPNNGCKYEAVALHAFGNNIGSLTQAATRQINYWSLWLGGAWIAFTEIAVPLPDIPNCDRISRAGLYRSFVQTMRDYTPVCGIGVNNWAVYPYIMRFSNCAAGGCLSTSSCSDPDCDCPDGGDQYNLDLTEAEQLNMAPMGCS